MIPPAESEAGLQAYEQVQAFAALRRKKLPWVYALFPVLLAIMGATAFAAGAALLGWGCLVGGGALRPLRGVELAAAACAGR